MPNPHWPERDTGSLAEQKKIWEAKKAAADKAGDMANDAGDAATDAAKDASDAADSAMEGMKKSG